jgi:hypothetical protein
VQPAELDSDGDGIPDWWEREHGFDPNEAGDALIDSDGDKMTNLEEFIAGTDPNDSSSYLYIAIDSALPGGGAVLSFQAVANRAYKILSSDNLSSGSWSSLVTIDPALTNRSVLWTNTAPGAGISYYRLLIPNSQQ